MSKQKLAETKQALRDLQEKKTAITDAAELKALNKQINALLGGNRRTKKRYPSLCLPEQKLLPETQNYSYLCRLLMNRL